MFSQCWALTRRLLKSYKQLDLVLIHVAVSGSQLLWVLSVFEAGDLLMLRLLNFGCLWGDLKAVLWYLCAVKRSSWRLLRVSHTTREDAMRYSKWNLELNWEWEGGIYNKCYS